jgi:hypothetical protein
MSNNGKILGQLTVYPNTVTNIYVVPSASTRTIVTEIIVCNLGPSDDLFSVSIAPGGGIDNPQQYVFYKIPINYPNTFEQTVKWLLSGAGYGDTVRVWCLNGYCSFTLMGVEIT